uniref:TatD DNase family protein n=1 Tax=Candidatus Kentrum sp. FM TaxID=2126340 RepID=A0A450RY74_9GAMM|nr:MAG: TatD DNase family protein [Candidatus Kentron sp. FM]VFJ43947.1 MAG: TatD DNase family protein [Candidatus Kentron sp. FM]VFK06038.1 MAG: TatD DNase family protein [Candidatus Kentron sp. FM]
MIDFHCHIDLYQNPHEVLAGIVRNRCFVVAVTTTPLAWEGTTALIGDTPGVHIAAGLHPELVASRHKEVELLCDLISKTKYVGEVGLDGSTRHRSSLPLQIAVFERIFQECERLGGKILSIHSRGASQAVFDCLRLPNRRSTPVLHWFSGTTREIKVATDLGCWFSVGPAMLSTKKGRSLVATMPRDHVLTETDGPFAGNTKGPFMPWDATQAVSGLSSIWGCPIHETQEQITTNIVSLVGSDHSPNSPMRC